jgi:hypothetical protein
MVNPRLKINVLARVNVIDGIFVSLENTNIEFDLDEFVVSKYL